MTLVKIYCLSEDVARLADWSHDVVGLCRLLAREVLNLV